MTAFVHRFSYIENNVITEPGHRITNFEPEKISTLPFFQKLIKKHLMQNKIQIACKVLLVPVPYHSY